MFEKKKENSKEVLLRDNVLHWQTAQQKVINCLKNQTSLNTIIMGIKMYSPRFIEKIQIKWTPKIFFMYKVL